MQAQGATGRRPMAWVLNLDAERELADPRSYRPSRAMLARVRAMRARIVGLLEDNDVVVDEEHAPVPPRAVGGCWCPTPRALARLEEAGIAPPPAPTLDVLQRVNHRAFCASLGQPLPGAAFVRDQDALRRVIGQRSETGVWLLKRPFGMAGRGQQRVRDGLEPSQRNWCDKVLAREGGLQVEPWVERVVDLSVHGWLGRDGQLVLGGVLLQRCDERGVWRGARLLPPGTLHADEHRQLVDGARAVGLALRAAGYFGPFGVDSFVYRRAGGRALHPHVEINARYCMSWGLGMGERRPDRAG